MTEQNTSAQVNTEADMQNIGVILVEPRFPENIGMAARACANMGVIRLIVVNPERWDYDKSAPLATPKGLPVLDSIVQCATLAEALAPFTHSFGTTARTGGWRRQILSPDHAAPLVHDALDAGGSVALVFGREDRGLTNEEIELCGRLLTIPTSMASSLNLAQAVLITLYECFKLCGTRNARPRLRDNGAGSRLVTHEEQAILFEALQETLLQINYLHEDNPEYFMLPLRRLASRVELRRHEFDMLMGICRQIKRHRK